jgi:thiol-disulfide isomerase/thioredoxin
MRPISLTPLLAILSVSLGCADEGLKSVVAGTLVGHDGRPMAVAHVHLLRAWADEPLVSLDLAGNPEFELKTAETGALVVRFTGLGHVAEDVPLFADSAQHIEVDVRLATPEYVDDFSGVVASGAFNGFSATPLEPQPDGRMIAIIESAEPEVTYYLAGATKTPHAPWIPGTDSAGLEYNLLYGYQSVIPTSEGKATVVFDPSELVRGSQSVAVRFHDPESRAARHYAIAAEVRNRIIAHTAAQWDHSESPRAAEPFEYDWSSDIADVRDRLSHEADPVLRQVLLWSMLGIADLDGEIEPAAVHLALSEIAPASPIWSYAPSFLSTALQRAEQTGETSQLADYFDQVVGSHPDPDVRATVLSSAMWSAQEAGDKEEALRHYERLVTEHPESWQADMASSQFASDRNIMVGKVIPEFVLTSLEDPELTYSRSDLEGEICLIDFWATWCLPCVGEMPNLHAAYERYNGRGFQILSVALGETRAAIDRFREVKWPMPWLHALHGWDDEAIAPFEVWSIPRAILVDRNGRILGADTDIQGEGLQEMLARVMDESR